MTKTYLLLLLFTFSTSYSQQDSRVRIDSGNRNEITVIQQGDNASKSSDITLKHSDSNKVNINQTIQKTTTPKSKLATFWNSISNINNVLGIIVSITTIIGSSTWLIVRQKLTNRK